MDWVLELRSESLTPIFLALTFLGDLTFFLIFLPLGYWLYRREAFSRLILLLLVSALANSILKAIFHVPRPDVPHLVEAGGWSFPSGHAQTAATLWPWLALELKRPWAWPAAVLLVAGVATSRVYLGVHRPVDVAAGVAVGLAMVALAWRWWPRERAWWERLGRHGRSLAVAAGVAAIVAFASVAAPDGGGVTAVAGGGLIGFWVGEVQRRFDFAAPEGPGGALAVIALGLAGAFGLRMGLAEAFAPLGERIADFLRYGAVGAWLSLMGPWTFCRLGWMPRGEKSAA